MLLTDEQADVLREAIYWWESLRPVSHRERGQLIPGWSLENHLANPTVNTKSVAEDSLARAVATFIESTF
jgi:hypothetical protein